MHPIISVYSDSKEITAEYLFNRDKFNKMPSATVSSTITFGKRINYRYIESSILKTGTNPDFHSMIDNAVYGKSRKN